MPNKVYRALETAISFRDSGGDATLTLQNLAFGVGRVSARYDQGSGSKPRRWTWRGVFQFETAPLVGELVEIYLFTSDGTYADGVVGTADAALTSDQRRNGRYLGAVVVDKTSVTTDIVGSGAESFEINDRYFSIGVWNGSAGDNLENTANASRVILTPVPDEIQ